MLHVVLSSSNCKLQDRLLQPIQSLSAITSFIRHSFAATSCFRHKESAQRCRRFIGLACLGPRQLICSLDISDMEPQQAERQVEQVLMGSQDKTVKRKVAMHVGYVGTAFRGNQL